MGIFDRLVGGPKPRNEVVVGEPGAAFNLPAKVPAKHQTPADALDYWCKKHKATYHRATVDGKVRICVFLPSGDVLAGNGDTTADAVRAVCAKLEVL